MVLRMQSSSALTSSSKRVVPVITDTWSKFCWVWFLFALRGLHCIFCFVAVIMVDQKVKIKPADMMSDCFLFFVWWVVLPMSTSMATLENKRSWSCSIIWSNSMSTWVTAQWLSLSHHASADCLMVVDELLWESELVSWKHNTRCCYHKYCWRVDHQWLTLFQSGTLVGVKKNWRGKLSRLLGGLLMELLRAVDQADLIATIHWITMLNLSFWINRVSWEKAGQEANPCSLESVTHRFSVHGWLLLEVRSVPQIGWLWWMLVIVIMIISEVKGHICHLQLGFPNECRWRSRVPELEVWFWTENTGI